MTRIWRPEIASDYEAEWQAAGERAFPSEIAGEVIPTFPLRHGYEDSRGFSVSEQSLLNQTAVTILTAGADENVLVTAASVRTAGLVDLWLDIFDGTNAVAVSRLASSIANEPVVFLERPLLLPPRMLLRARANPATGVGNALIGDALFIRKRISQPFPSL